MAQYYVKFMRGTPKAYEAAVKNSDTLYFITEPGENVGKLYLGEVLLAGGSGESTSDLTLKDLAGINLSDSVPDGSILVYDSILEEWKDAPLSDVIGVDNETIGLNESNVLSLYNYGKQYYKYIEEVVDEETGTTVAAHYEIQIVDEEHPWKAGLELKLSEEDGKIVLGWYEPNSTTVDGINTQIAALQQAIEDTYSKSETEELINSAIANADHLQRVVVESLEEAENLAAGENGHKYIYMILNDDGTYDEYALITNPETGEAELSRAGSWETDLADYVKKDEQYITGVDSEFTVVDGTLSINEISADKVEGLGDLKSVVNNLDNIYVKQEIYLAEVGNLSELMKINEEDTTIVDAINTLTDKLIWKELTAAE